MHTAFTCLRRINKLAPLIDMHAHSWPTQCTLCSLCPGQIEFEWNLQCRFRGTSQTACLAWVEVYPEQIVSSLCHVPLIQHLTLIADADVTGAVAGRCCEGCLSKMAHQQHSTTLHLFFTVRHLQILLLWFHTGPYHSSYFLCCMYLAGPWQPH